MSALAWCLWGIGGAICLLNLYLSTARWYVERWLHPTREYRWVSGIPLLGSILVAVSLSFGQLPGWAVIVGGTLILVDTGGIHWFVGRLAWEALRRPRR